MGRDIHLWTEPLDTNAVSVYANPVPAPFGVGVVPLQYTAPRLVGRVGESGALSGAHPNR